MAGKLKITCLASVLLLTLFVGFLATVFSPAPTAAALSGSSFKASRIIDDAIFYDKNSLNQTQIQAFLNAKVPTCDTNGTTMIYDSTYGDTVTRKTYAQRRGVSTPFICLKTYTQNTTNKPVEAGLCNGHSAGNKNAARIIYEVSQSCGVSPKVIIILLQREQSLVTDTWPWPIQYQKATGYACPDTASCQAQYSGFFNQVYNAARIYKVYRANPLTFNHVAGRNNAVRWHPNVNCGSSTVFIESQATAGLYNYTPYRPNNAALSNLYGTGDSCSAYGIRNFWRMFNDWFGATIGPPTYAWGLVSRSTYTDAGFTNEIDPDNFSMLRGSTVYIRIRARNTGNQVWHQLYTKLATVRPQNRISPFADGSWLSGGRLTLMNETSVVAGDIATFEASLTAPDDFNTFVEKYNLVIENKAWLAGPDMRYDIEVFDPNPVYRVQILDTQVYLDAARTKPINPNNLYLVAGSSVYATSTFKNTGNRDIVKADPVRLATTSPRNRTSDFYDSSWPATNRLVDLEQSVVAPKQVGTFKYILTAPSTPGDYNESFGVVSSTVGWMDNDQITLGLKVGAQEPPTLLSNDRLYENYVLKSKNGGFRLVLQGDGNLVLYSPNRATWSTRTNGTDANRLIMQGDGNMVLYRNGKPVWSTGTNGFSNAGLNVQNDGNMVMYKNGKAVWSTGTRGKF